MKALAIHVARWSALSLFLLSLIAAASCAAMAESYPGMQDAVHRLPELPANARKPELSPVPPELRAELLALHHQYLAAIEIYKQITPQTAQIYNETGIAYEHMYMDEAARISFEHALKLDRKFAQAYNNLGTVYYSQGDYSKAEHLYKKALKLDPGDASYYSNLGTLYFTRKKFSKGAEAYQRAFALDNNVFLKDTILTNQASGMTQDMAHMDYCLAKLYAHAGMNGLAIQYLRKAFIEGFHDETSLRQDKEFATLRETTEFQRLMNEEHK